MAIVPKITPADGMLAVIREEVSEMTEGGIIKPEDVIDLETRSNPFALVVAVGPPRKCDDGSYVVTSAQEGDEVAHTMAGMMLKLFTPEGQKVDIYLIPFESITGFKEWRCTDCNNVSRRKTETCEKCKPLIATPTLAQISKVNH